MVERLEAEGAEVILGISSTYLVSGHSVRVSSWRIFSEKLSLGVFLVPFYVEKWPKNFYFFIRDFAIFNT